MKKQLLFLAATGLSLSLVFTGCKKDDTKKTDDSAKITQEATVQSDDQARFDTELDAVANDAGLALESNTDFSARPGDVQGLICDATVNFDAVSNPMLITITYNGTNCSGTRTREGVVTISMPQGVHWKNAGAAVTVNFQNLKITRVIDNKSIKINGSQTYTNVSGGLLLNLASLQSITHSITSAGLTVTFDDNSQRSWQVAKQRVFSFSAGVVISTTGTHTEGSDTHVAEWGTNRFGIAFTSSIIQPLVIRQSCDFRLTSGEVTHATAGYLANVKFGLDATGNETSCPGAGHYFFKLTWVGPNGGTGSFILPY